MSLIALLIWIVFGTYGFGMVLYFDVRDDIKKWRSAIEVIHRKESIQRALALTMPIGVFTLIAWVSVHNIPLALVGALLFLGGIYWILFDGLYNYSRKEHFFYPGSPNGKKDDSLFDRGLRLLPGSDKPPFWGIIVFKVVVVSLTTGFYLWLTF